MFGLLSYNATPPRSAAQSRARMCRDRSEIELCDARHIVLDFRSATERRSYFAFHIDIEDLRGLDLFHNRFAPDPRRNPSSRMVVNQFSDKLERLEEG